MYSTLGKKKLFFCNRVSGVMNILQGSVVISGCVDKIRKVYRFQTRVLKSPPHKLATLSSQQQQVFTDCELYYKVHRYMFQNI